MKTYSCIDIIVFVYIIEWYTCSYRGHVPTMKFDYCETYGNHTVKYFQDFRSSVLNSSKSNFCKGGYFPTYYSYNPNLATEARTRKWDRWLQVPAYSLSNMDHDRREELIQFNKVFSRVQWIFDVLVNCLLIVAMP